MNELSHDQFQDAFSDVCYMETEAIISYKKTVSKKKFFEMFETDEGIDKFYDILESFIKYTSRGYLGANEKTKKAYDYVWQIIKDKYKPNIIKNKSEAAQAFYDVSKPSAIIKNWFCEIK